MPGLWSEEADQRLWALRSKPTATLATEFGKTSGAIRSRLKHLQDPTHKAYQRRVGASPSALGAGPSSSRRPGLGGGHSSTPYVSPFARTSPSHTSTFAAAAPFVSPFATAAASASTSHSSSPFVSPSVAAPAATDTAYSNPFAINLNTTSVPQVSPPAPTSATQPRVDPSTLNADQQAAATYILSGGNAFLTGAAGVGKSYLLRLVIEGLREKYEPAGIGESQPSSSSSSSNNNNDGRVVVAAATGIAATHIDGVTVHSWAGIRLGRGGARVLVPRVLQNEAACQRWRKAQVLVLDEVSMIDGMLFEALDAIGREVRGRPDVPFGGIQLVLSGDFFQLPPVSLAQCGFAFQAPAWGNASVQMVELRTVVRQSGDQTFTQLLNQIRIGDCPPWITQALDACHISRKPRPVDGIVPTKLYCTNRNVDQENDRKLNELPGESVTFNATDYFKGTYTHDVQRTVRQAMDKKVPSELRLKVGAQVIITRNMQDYNLVNGSRGIVKSFEWDHNSRGSNSSAGGDKKIYPVVHFSNGVKMRVKEEEVFQGGSAGALVRTQLPLKLAWSLTVHKSQGMTIERAELQLDDAFDFGQVYVALSRITSLEGLWIRGGCITQSVVKAHPLVKAFYQQSGSLAF